MGIGGHDITINPAYSVVCHIRAINLLYASNKQCLGPRTTKLWPTCDSMMVRKQHTTRASGTRNELLYAALYNWVLHFRPLGLVSSPTLNGKVSQQLQGNGWDGGRAAAHVVMEEVSGPAVWVLCTHSPHILTYSHTHIQLSTRPSLILLLRLIFWNLF